MLDRYELLCTIARGGMAHVWLGRFKGKHGFEKLVAVKTILPEHALDERFRSMFLDEARIASGVDHPNVAKILDLGEWRDCLYLVMEYVDGDSLSRLRRSVEKQKVDLPLPLALRIFADVCAGLHAAHELRADDGTLLAVVHRDISPQNVLIPVNGVSKLIDFGVAKARHRLGEETSAGFAKGKSRYMSPEQALAKPVDRRADLFAVGAMIYELFENQAPYDGPNDMARLHALINGHEITAMKHAPHAAVEKVVLKALARDPDARFTTAGEMRAAIEDAMVSLKVRAAADDLASFVLAHTTERIEERKHVVKLAIDGAAERQRIKEMVERGTVAGRKQESSPGLEPSDEFGVVSVPTLGGGESPLVESAPPAYSASVDGVGSSLTRRRSLMLAIISAAVLASLLLVAFALRNNHAAAAEPTAKPTASAATPVAPINIPPPTTTESATAIATVSTPEHVDVPPHRVIVAKPHASATTRPKSRDVVIQ
jgi:serine/threonine protein kinase